MEENTSPFKSMHGEEKEEQEQEESLATIIWAVLCI